MSWKRLADLDQQAESSPWRFAGLSGVVAGITLGLLFLIGEGVAEGVAAFFVFGGIVAASVAIGLLVRARWGARDE